MSLGSPLARFSRPTSYLTRHVTGVIFHREYAPRPAAKTSRGTRYNDSSAALRLLTLFNSLHFACISGKAWQLPTPERASLTTADISFGSSFIIRRRERERATTLFTR